MAGKGRTVIVNPGGIRALEEPRFLIEWEDKYYLTVAVLEYDPQHPDLSHEQRQVMGHLDQTLGTTQLRATSMSMTASMDVSPAHTGDYGDGSGGSDVPGG